MDPQERKRRLSDQAFRDAYEKHRGNVHAIQEELGCSRPTVYRRRKKLRLGNVGLPPPATGSVDLLGLIPKPDPNHIHRKVEDLINSALSTLWAISLVGDAGTGKTKIVKQIAAQLRLPFLRIPCDSTVEFSDFLGSYQLSGMSTVFVEGLLIQVMRVPSIILFDEFNALDPSKSFLIHQLLDSRCVFVKEANRTYQMHDGCRIFLAGNPPGNGYAVPPATAPLLNRVLCIELPPFSSEEVAQVLRKAHPQLDANISRKLIHFYEDVQRLVKEQKVNARISIRNMVMFGDMYRLTNDVPQSLSASFLDGILLTDDSETRDSCRRIAEATFGNQWSTRSS